jgi:lipopolysaccharide transport system ATP-binding protein
MATLAKTIVTGARRQHVSEIDLRLENVSKRYRIQREADSIGPNDWINRARRLLAPKDTFWAVKNVSFSLQRGEVLGIIGHNGAGKSTLLKLLSGITAPTSGQITVRGRMSALLEVGSGFHPELTGRENIFLSGSILGMSRKEIHSKLHSIVDFAEVRTFIDVPVKRYSSGMYVRLGFSIAAHLEPDILLLDEVLAVGDSDFQEKCIDRILGLRKGGMTIVFISHDLSTIENICDRVLIMERGEIADEGDPRKMIGKFRHRVASFQ